MQHRYTGDIGDYAKYGLLRDICGHVKLGVAWYLYPDEDNNDGRHIPYLTKPEKWRHLDPELFDTLKQLVDNQKRSITQIERSGILGNATFSGVMLDFDGTPKQRSQHRAEWFTHTKQTLSHCDIVFADPDNGLCIDEKYRPTQRKFWKRMPLSEASALSDGRTGILYHHNSMFPGGHYKEIQFWLSQLGSSTLALYWRPYSPRTFFIVNPGHELQRHIERFAKKWSPHFQLIGNDMEIPAQAVRDKEHPSRSRRDSETSKRCPACGHLFMGAGWGGIDAHWKAQHEHIMPYKEAWPLIKEGMWRHVD